MAQALQPQIECRSITEIWEVYAADRLPPSEVATSYTHEQVREAFISAAWAMLTIEQRTRTRRRRSALFRRWRTESKLLLQSVFGQF